MEKYVVAFCPTGISNRLKCLISAMRFAEKYSRKLILCWPKNKLLNCRFSDLFDNNIPEIDLKEMKMLQHKKNVSDRYKIIATWRLLSFPEDDLPKNLPKAPYDIPDAIPGITLDYEYDRIPELVRKKILIYVNKLMPVQYIRDEVSSFSKKFNNRTVSFCIRTWIEEKRRADLFDKKAVYEIIDRISLPDLFVTCDSQKFLNKLIKKYGNQILYYPKRTFAGDSGSVRGMQDILIDLYLTSKNEYLKAPYMSTFPELAWWLGGCKSQVEIISRKSK